MKDTTIENNDDLSNYQKSPIRNPQSEIIGIVGLGYVGLPLAAAFASVLPVIGYDTKPSRIEALNQGFDETGEVEFDQLAQPHLSFVSNPNDLKKCTFIIVTVPTPITENREPNLSCLKNASEIVGRILRKNTMVVYESTVYPGVTEEVCLPILERESGLKLGDFALGYSPERVNPGDKEHTIPNIVKVVSGHDEDALNRAVMVYGKIIKAGIHKAPTLKTAEAAKVIENVQRDLNIALMNELSKIFSRMQITTRDVLEAAGTKWNFHPYHPGLVGGHCIGVDPYYLTHRAVEMGYTPEVILAGRRINDDMGAHFAGLIEQALHEAGVLLKDAHVWVLGLTFKENVPDLRNTRAVDAIKHLQKHGIRVSVWEPLVKVEELKDRYEMEFLSDQEIENLDAVMLINGHDHFKSIKLQELRTKMRTPILLDLKNFFSKRKAIESGFNYITT
ncbi:MAG: nucleotide sugar dehydrogenase [Kiritimatiellae bacterium]|nr:nucleotide sugar dehydrogenase [Kiritimatiellia bacterium]